ncbi:M-like protein [Deinococcus radiophilus]|uniref:M-like protein n=1 Tax=Deinococcus radiophilus TaxID=32062 RepID=A0A3S0IB32_9DEIO|nr:M-like protein [Deinococcus radiophilus]RTR29416.1 M-like protein [Deinococcus radiophilus]UFA50756.1 M-like protein [Deinococcus radiophilus]
MTDHNNQGDQQESQEISNVDLQFQHTRAAQQGKNDDLNAEVVAESSEPGQYEQQGLDRHDVGVEQTMDASDPPSTNMGDDENRYGEK